MNRSYMESKKYDALPWVKDWTDPQDHIRKSNNIKALAFWDWYYCHPSSYKLQYFGINPIIIVFLSLPMIWIISKGAYFFALFPGIIIVIAIIDLIRKISKRHEIKDMTFYDMYFRDYTPKK